MTKEDLRLQSVIDDEQARRELEEIDLEQGLEKEFKGLIL